MMNKFHVFWFATFILQVYQSNGQSQCRTLQGGTGNCVILTDCPDLYALLRPPVSQQNADLLRRSRCGGYSGNLPRVCCSRSGASPGVSGPPRAPEAPVANNILPDTQTCGIQQNEDKIVGGERTAVDEFPWMALLQYTKPRGLGFHCGGVLISSRYILTAAHCVNGRDIPRTWSLTGVRLGEWNTRTDPDCDDSGCAPSPVDIRIESTKVHESYNPNSSGQQNDIALLRLSQDVQYSDYIQPICLPRANPTVQNLNLVGNDLYVAGWGRTENRTDSEVKLKVRIPVVRNDQCNQRYQSVNVNLGSSQICAGGERGKDSCRGDSGGPLMMQTGRGTSNWYIIGVVSFGPSPCGLENWPGVYTKVADYSNWIARNVLP